MVDLAKGETVVLYPAGQPPPTDDFAIAPVASQPDRENWFGGRKTPWVRAGPNDMLELTAVAAALRGASLIRETKAPAGNIGRWIEPSDHIVWRVQAPRASAWAVALRYAGPQPAALRLRIERMEAHPEGEPIDLRIDAPATGGYADFHTLPAGQVRLPEAGGYTFTLGSADGRAPKLNIEHLRLIPYDAP